MAHVSDIKLIRTDTTLDLSQKAEKGILIGPESLPFIACPRFLHRTLVDVGQNACFSLSF